MREWRVVFSHAGDDTKPYELKHDEAAARSMMEYHASNNPDYPPVLESRVVGEWGEVKDA